MKRTITHKILTIVIATVWLVNGLFCKVFNLVPRHQQIVSEILGETYAKEITVTIGCLEILMAFWILSRFKYKFNAVIQMVIIAAMNILEFTLVQELLLWGKWNIVFALIFMLLIYYNNFIHKTQYVSNA